MPSVASLVVRRRRKQPVRATLTPIRLAFQVRAVTGPTLIRVNRLSLGEKRRIGRVRKCRTGFLPIDRGNGCDCGPGHENENGVLPHESALPARFLPLQGAERSRQNRRTPYPKRYSRAILPRFVQVNDWRPAHE